VPRTPGSHGTGGPASSGGRGNRAEPIRRLSERARGIDEDGVMTGAGARRLRSYPLLEESRRARGAGGPHGQGPIKVYPEQEKVRVGQRVAESHRIQIQQANVSASNVDRTFAALADPYRRRVIDLLRERPHRAGELAQAVRLSFPAMSRHLRTIRSSGLVAEDRDEFDSRVRIYRLRPEALGALRTWLAETDALWARQLAALKAHLQKTRR